MRFIKFCALVMAMGFICIVGASVEAKALQCDSCTGSQYTKLPAQFLFCGLEPGTQYKIKLANGGEFTGEVFSGVEQMLVECGSIYFKTPADMEQGQSLVISVGLFPNLWENLTGSIIRAADGGPVQAQVHFAFYNASAATNQGRFAIGPGNRRTSAQCVACDCNLATGDGCPRNKDCYVFKGMRMCCDDVPY
jgi:hypothetical protein